MSTLFRTAALAALLLVSLGALRPFQQPVDALGDSITAPQDSYVQVAGEMLGRPVDDEAQFGWTSAQIATEYLNPTAAYVVVNAGTNDIWPIARRAKLRQHNHCVDPVLSVSDSSAPSPPGSSGSGLFAADRFFTHWTNASWSFFFWDSL